MSENVVKLVIGEAGACGSLGAAETYLLLARGQEAPSSGIDPGVKACDCKPPQQTFAAFTPELPRPGP